MANKIEFLQINLQKAKQAQIEIGQKIRSLISHLVVLFALYKNPKIFNSRLAGQPKTVNVILSNITRVPLYSYTDSHMQGWFIEALSTRDITVFQTMVNRKSTLLISAYLEITLLHVIPQALHKVMEYAELKGFGIILGIDTNIALALDLTLISAVRT